VSDDGGVFACAVLLPGCPCEDSDPRQIVCSLPQETTGSCRRPLSECRDGRYSECTLIADATCDHVGVDQGVIGLTPDNSDNVKKGVDGDIILDPDVSQQTFGYLWIANTGENTVSKIDVDTGKEVARYAAVRDATALGLVPVPMGGFGGTGSASNCGNCPSRTAIDFHGDAFVANRAFSQQGSVTKFANDAADCVDRNTDGVIQTSIDANGDGMIDPNDPAEFFAEDDECILWTVTVGGVGGVPRALAIDAGGPDGENGNLWVGLFNSKKVVKLSGNTGAPVLDAGQPVEVALDDGSVSMNPYGAAIDSAQHVWLTSLDGAYLARVDSLAHALVAIYTVPANGSKGSHGYGIAVDVKQRVWLAGYTAQNVKTYLPATDEWKVGPDVGVNTRGIAVDAAGDVWFAQQSGKVGRVGGDDVVANGTAAQVTTYVVPDLALPEPQGINTTIGVGIDRNGACWVVSRNDGIAKGAATRIRAADDVQSFPTGRNPYTYSDFTGYGLLTVVRPQGWFRVPIEGCPSADAKTVWRTLTWIESEPPGTSIRLKVRVADTLADLANATWFGPWDTSPVDLQAAGVPPTRYLEVEVDLSSANPEVSPAFSGFDVAFDACAVGPG
jgi:streptogramin lyase